MPIMFDALLNLGLVYQGEKHYDLAISNFRKAVELQPNSAEAHNNLGFALLQNGNLKQAIQELRHSIELKPEYAGAHYNLAWRSKQAERSNRRMSNINLPASSMCVDSN